MHIVLAGGGTAGHIEPAMNLADALRRRDPSIAITALGTARGLEVRLVPERGYDLVEIPPVPMPRRASVDMVTLPGRVRRSVTETRAVLRSVNADVVVGFGGYVALPAYLAARGRWPIVVHEANARPGIANRIGARSAAAVAAATDNTGLRGAVRMGIPLRQTIATLDRQKSGAEGRRYFDLPQEGPVLLIFGGSQGARRVNRATGEALAGLSAAGVSVLHAVGSARVEAPEVVPDGMVYRQVDYIDRMDLAYAAADLAICRSGAMTCAEVAAVGLPAIYVPFPIGNGEQRFNALPVADAGGGLIVNDADFDGAALLASALPLLGDAAALQTMSAAAGAHGVRDGAERLADLVLSVARPAAATTHETETQP